MELKVLKKEINNTAKINKTLSQFKTSWLKQIKENTNSHFPFLQKLDKKTKREINNQLHSYQKICRQLEYAQFTQEKLSSLAHYLIELKLTTLNTDKNKSQLLLNKFIDDDFLKLKNLVDEAHQFEFNLKGLEQIYRKTNRTLFKNLPSQHSAVLMKSPHKKHLNSLFLISKKQKLLLKILGKEFIYLVKDMKNKRKI